MSSLSKKLFIFLVFSILCNLTTSDDVQDCTENLYEVFQTFHGPQKNFEIAMFALSEKLLSSTFTPKKLYQHFAKQDEDVINNFGAGIFSSKHKEILAYFGFVSSVKDAVDMYPNYKTRVDSLSIGDLSDSMGDSSISIEDSSSAIEDSSSAIEDSSSAIEDSSSAIVADSSSSKQANLLGYFQSFAEKIKENGSTIDGFMLSPQKFCEDHDKITCHRALCTMLNLKMTEINSMSGSEALRYCFLNYTYLDFTTDTFFPQSDDSSSISLDEFDIMIKYFDHMLDTSRKMVEINEKKGKYELQRVGGLKYRRYVVPGVAYQDPEIFFTVEKYCETAVKNKQ